MGLPQLARDHFREGRKAEISLNGFLEDSYTHLGSQGGARIKKGFRDDRNERFPRLICIFMKGTGFLKCFYGDESSAISGTGTAASVSAVLSLP